MAHQVRCGGVLALLRAGGTGWCREILKCRRQCRLLRWSSSRPESPKGMETARGRSSDRIARRSTRVASWLHRLGRPAERIVEADALGCPTSGEWMRLISAITALSVAPRLLECLALPHWAPALFPARAIDPGSVVGRRIRGPVLVEPAGNPDFTLDQSPTEGPIQDDAS